MSTPGKRVAEVKIKSDADVFHQLWTAQQTEVPKLTPTTIQQCQTQGGETGTVGCVLFWNYFLDGKDCVAKSLITDIDEDKKSVTYKILEGDLMERYKTISVNIQVETDGVNNVVTWTVEYEKLSPDVPDPDTLMDFYRKATKDIESHTLKAK